MAADPAFLPSFNESDAVHQLTRRHITYIGRSRKSICFRPADFIVSEEEECYYVTSTETCFELVKIFNYLKILVCDLKIDRSLIGAAKIVTFSVFMVFLSVFCMIIITKYFILPNFLTLSRNFHMSGYKFGIIINSMMLLFPTIFHVLFRTECVDSAHAWSESMDPITMKICLVFGQMVPALLIGFTLISYPSTYRARPLPLLINLLVGAAAHISIRVVGMYETFLRNVAPQPNYVLRMRIYCAILLVVYCVHLFGHIVVWCKTIEEDRAKELRRQEIRHSRIMALKRLKKVRRVSQQRKSIWSYFTSLPVEQRESPTEIPAVQEEKELEPSVTAWSTFYCAINPFEHLKRWPHFSKVFICPLWVLLALLMPVFDEDRPIGGWSKYLLCITFVVTPALIYRDSSPSPLWYVIWGATILTVFLILIFTKATKAPKYYYYFAFLGTFNGLSVFYVLNGEIRNMAYQILSYMNDWSRDALTLIAQPIGVCLGEGVFCWTLVRSQRSELAYGVIFSLLSFTTFILLPEAVFNPCFSAINQVTITDNAVTSFVFLMVATALILVSASITDFQLRRSHSIFYMILLALYVLFTCLANSDRMHPYGSQHSLLFEPAYSNANWA